uniref:TLDc domain-containing protein n=1 Tax=Acrobeloides nanus TaxID=290746 RepID=A0A914EIX0_9BILA
MSLFTNFNQIFYLTISTRHQATTTTNINNIKVNTNLIDSSIHQTRLLNLTILNSAITPKVQETERTISSTITSPVTLAITPTTKPPDNSTIKQTTTPPEPNAYFYPKGQDNTKPLDDTNLLKELPIHGCTNKTNLLVGVRTSPKEFTEREWIRNNWGCYRNPEVPLIFLIGNTNVCGFLKGVTFMD